MPKPSILVIEDDRSLAEVLEYNLVNAGYDTIRASDGLDGLNQARLKLPDLVVLDLMIPVIDGLEVCRRLRASAETRDLLILMLTAKSEESDQLVGFSLGADDYVCKPFSVKVLLERIKSLLRRKEHAASAAGEQVARHGVMVDRVKHRVTAGGQPIELTPSEFRLLDTLIRQPGRAFDRRELMDAALGEGTLVTDRTIASTSTSGR